MAITKPQRDALARQDADFLPRGLVPNDPRSSEAHLRQTARLLADRQTNSPSARAVAHVVELFERSVPEASKAMLACRSGCAFCCRQPVAVTPPEAFYLAAALQLRPDAQAAMEAVVAASQDRDPGAPDVSWFACPLLGPDNSCSAYRARPTPCRAFVSVNVQDCETKLLHFGDATVMEPRGYSQLKDICRLLLLAAMQANGLPLQLYEMNAAVVTVLKTPKAEKRWLRGENIFEGVRSIKPLNAQTLQTVGWLAQNIAATL